MHSIVFFGSSPFSVVCLDQFVKRKVHIKQVVTKPDKPVGRHLKVTPNPVKVFALKHEISVSQSVSNISGELGVVAAYGQILPQSVLEAFKGQIFNIHPSLLPKYRGPSPLQQQIIDGGTQTGVTIIQLDSQMDHGPIVAVENDVIHTDDTAQSLGERLFKKGADLFVNQVLNQQVSPQPQDHSQATYTKLLTRQDGFVPWEKFQRGGEDIIRMYRAYFPWPGVWSINPKGERVIFKPNS